MFRGGGGKRRGGAAKGAAAVSTAASCSLTRREDLRVGPASLAASLAASLPASLASSSKDAAPNEAAPKRGVTPVLDSRREAEAGAAARPERRAPSGAASVARELLPRVARRLDGRRSSSAALEFFLVLLLLFCSGGGTGGSSGTATGSRSCTRLTAARLTRMGAGRPAGDVSPTATDVLNCALTE